MGVVTECSVSSCEVRVIHWIVLQILVVLEHSVFLLLAVDVVRAVGLPNRRIP